MIRDGCVELNRQRPIRNELSGFGWRDRDVALRPCGARAGSGRE